jgi:FKBP-type peptidyl-prolyl cis-trans isomerase FkpA
MSVTTVPIRPIKKGSVAKLWIGLAVLSLAAAGAAWVGTKGAIDKDPGSILARNAGKEGVTTTASGLQIQTVRPGTGATPGPNDMVLVDYEGRLPDGTVFDASAKHGGPQPFPVSGIIPGWTEALQMMKEGGTYHIWLPPKLGYGEQGTPGGEIPPNTVLDFEIILHQVANQEQVRMMQEQQMRQQIEQGGGPPGPPGQ